MFFFCSSIIVNTADAMKQGFALNLASSPITPWQKPMEKRLLVISFKAIQENLNGFFFQWYNSPVYTTQHLYTLQHLSISHASSAMSPVHTVLHYYILIVLPLHQYAARWAFLLFQKLYFWSCFSRPDYWHRRV